MRTTSVVFVVVVLVVGLGSGCVCDTEGEPENVAGSARSLVGEGSWGVLATLNKTAGGKPFGNVVSYTDAGTGNPYFYLSRSLDPTGMFALNDSRASFTVSQVELNDCRGTDPQSPLCARITLSGDVRPGPSFLFYFFFTQTPCMLILDSSPSLQLLPLDGKENSRERAFAEAVLFKTHPQFTGFPLKNGTFAVFKLYIHEVFFVNAAAPGVYIPPTDYFSPPDN